MDDDPIDNALKSRRLPHGKSKTRDGAAQTFNVFRAINEYSVTLGTQKSRGRQLDHTPKSWLTVHGLTCDENGLIASLNLANVLAGVGVLAGSRKLLENIVVDFDKSQDVSPGRSDDDEKEGVIRDEGESADRDEDENEDDDEDEEAAENDDDDDDDADNKDDEEDDEDEESAREDSHERGNRLASTFAKNSFRQPKFWLRWRALIRSNQSATDLASAAPSSSSSAAPAPAQLPLEQTVNQFDASSVDTGMGYLVFTGNACQTFEGTISCRALGWKNVKIRGDKIKASGNRTLTREECQALWQLGQTNGVV